MDNDYRTTTCYQEYNSFDKNHFRNQRHHDVCCERPNANATVFNPTTAAAAPLMNADATSRLVVTRPVENADTDDCKQQNSSWSRKPEIPSWIKSRETIRIKPTPETELLPRVCPRFLVENKTRWNRVNQQWEPILKMFAPVRANAYCHSSCPFHKGYEI